MTSNNSQFLDQHILFKECLDALKVEMLSSNESTMISEVFINLFPITKWGKIDWDKINAKIDANFDQGNIISSLEILLKKPIDKNVYIEWDNGALPVIKSNLDDIIKNFDDVTCVSFEKFIFNLDQKYVIEVRPGNQITIGVLDGK